MYTPINASKEQVETFLKKHIKWIFGRTKIISKSYSYNSEDKIGFVSLDTITGKRINYQFYNDTPRFVEFTYFGDIRYDVAYPEKLNQELFDILKKYGIKAKNDFWKGGQI